MKDDQLPEVPTSAAETEVRRRRHTRWALAFGVIMATLQTGALLWFMYC